MSKKLSDSTITLQLEWKKIGNGGQVHEKPKFEGIFKMIEFLMLTSKADFKPKFEHWENKVE